MEKQMTLIEARNYLVKGCAPQIYRSGEPFPIDPEGPVHQRRWLIADAAKQIFRSQRHKGFGRLALIRPELAGNKLVLRTEGMPDCEVPCDESGGPTTTTIWDAEVPVRVHANASEWVSDFMKQHLLFVQQAGDRPVNSIYAPEEATVGFADRFPLTMVSEATIAESQQAAASSTMNGNRYRYNLLIGGCAAQDENRMVVFRIGSFVGKAAKPCGRCNTINVNQETGEEDINLYDVLKNHPGFCNSHTGEPVIAECVLVQQPGIITVGSPVEVSNWSEEGWDRPYFANHWRHPRIKGSPASESTVGLWRRVRNT